MIDGFYKLFIITFFFVYLPIAIYICIDDDDDCKYAFHKLVCTFFYLCWMHSMASKHSMETVRAIK